MMTFLVEMLKSLWPGELMLDQSRCMESTWSLVFCVRYIDQGSRHGSQTPCHTLYMTPPSFLFLLFMLYVVFLLSQSPINSFLSCHLHLFLWPPPRISQFLKPYKLASILYFVIIQFEFLPDFADIVVSILFLLHPLRLLHLPISDCLHVFCTSLPILHWLFFILFFLYFSLLTKKFNYLIPPADWPSGSPDLNPIENLGNCGEQGQTLLMLLSWGITGCGFEGVGDHTPSRMPKSYW